MPKEWTYFLRLIAIALLLIGLSNIAWGLLMSDPSSPEFSESAAGIQRQKINDCYLQGTLFLVAGLFLSTRKTVWFGSNR